MAPTQGTAEAAFLLASRHAEKAEQYKAYGDSTHRLGYVKPKKSAIRSLPAPTVQRAGLIVTISAVQLTARSAAVQPGAGECSRRTLRALITLPQYRSALFRADPSDEKNQGGPENKYDSALLEGHHRCQGDSRVEPEPAGYLPIFNPIMLEIKIDMDCPEANTGSTLPVKLVFDAGPARWDWPSSCFPNQLFQPGEGTFFVVTANRVNRWPARPFKPAAEI